jgi:CheY-like chemotaxis protein
MDDEEPILKMAERLMKRMGFDVESVTDGKAAIELYRSAKEAGRPFNVVIMDLTIPGGMGGREAISVLSKYDPKVRAIVSSGYSSDLAMSDFRKHGFRGMVAKPYDISELAPVTIQHPREVRLPCNAGAYSRTNTEPGLYPQMAFTGRAPLKEDRPTRA